MQYNNLPYTMYNVLNVPILIQNVVQLGFRALKMNTTANATAIEGLVDNFFVGLTFEHFRRLFYVVMPWEIRIEHSADVPDIFFSVRLYTSSLLYILYHCSVCTNTSTFHPINILTQFWRCNSKIRA